VTLLVPDGQLLINSTGTFSLNWPSSDPHHRFVSRDSPGHITVIAFLSRTLTSLSWGPRDTTGRRPCHLDTMLCQHACCQFLSALQIISQRESGPSMLHALNSFMGTNINLYPSPWIARSAAAATLMIPDTNGRKHA
jgi:hypothetical protein